MVPDHFDLDVIVPVSAFRGKALAYPDDWRDEELTLGMRREVKKYLQQETGCRIHIPEDAHYRYVLQLMIDGVEVDLLLVPDLVKGTPADPVWEQHVALVADMYNVERPEYDQLGERADSGALTAFLAGVHDDVKGVVRLVKGLYKCGVQEGEVRKNRIGSIALETLVLAADQQLQMDKYKGGRPSSRGNRYKLELFEKTLELIIAAVRGGEVVMVDAGAWGYSRKQGMRFRYNWADDQVKIIHPIHPTCNLARLRVRRGPSDWEGLAAAAEGLLEVVREGTFEQLQQTTIMRRTLLEMMGPRMGGDAVGFA